MGLFRETLEEARCYAITGDLENAKKITVKHWANYSTAPANGILLRMQNNIKEYREALANANRAKDKNSLVKNIDICLNKLKLTITLCLL